MIIRETNHLRACRNTIAQKIRVAARNNAFFLRKRENVRSHRETPFRAERPTDVGQNSAPARRTRTPQNQNKKVGATRKSFGQHPSYDFFV